VEVLQLDFCQELGATWWQRFCWPVCCGCILSRQRGRTLLLNAWCPLSPGRHPDCGMYLSLLFSYSTLFSAPHGHTARPCGLCFYFITPCSTSTYKPCFLSSTPSPHANRSFSYSSAQPPTQQAPNPLSPPRCNNVTGPSLQLVILTPRVCLPGQLQPLPMFTPSCLVGRARRLSVLVTQTSGVQVCSMITSSSTSKLSARLLNDPYLGLVTFIRTSRCKPGPSGFLLLFLPQTTSTYSFFIRPLGIVS